MILEREKNIQKGIENKIKKVRYNKKYKKLEKVIEKPKDTSGKKV